jgi:hypothetical protein
MLAGVHRLEDREPERRSKGWRRPRGLVYLKGLRTAAWPVGAHAGKLVWETTAAATGAAGQRTGIVCL